MSTDQKTSKPKRRWRPTRRGFLIGAGVAGVGVALGIGFGVPYGRLQLARCWTMLRGRAASTRNRGCGSRSHPITRFGST
ncbi:MAG: twin-arginine translocation signal domain-containing protein [Caldilineaceae bacterium]